VLARFRLARHSALDELGNYTQAEPAFRSSQLRKSCSVTPSFACIERRRCAIRTCGCRPDPRARPLPLWTTSTTNAALPLVREAEDSAP
jgi:hypothetical protein